ncbi:MAG TPA: OmpA family protein [Vicinamibacterales bacterium]|nr:OmpA family protein [Vicinamibacterales bacterium]
MACGVLTAGAAFAQSAPNPTQRSTAVVTAENGTPLFRVTVVGRTTPAVNYRPRSGDTKIDFEGTPLMPMAKGSAVVSGEKGYIHIDARFDKLAPPARFGREYLTYVLWAITPEGRATNLGEVQRDDQDARVKVTTELQAFGLILTAEPYFAVTQPSDVVVMENVLRDNTKGRAETIQAKYELLKRGTYLMNQDAGRLTIKPLEPGAPLDLAEARNAVALARLAGADRYAADTFNKAAALLNDAETAREKRRNKNDIMQPARQAAQTAEDARIVGLQRQEEEYLAEQRRVAAAREQDALARARAEAEQRRQAELNAQAAASQRADAERAKAEADAARAQADAARQAAEAERQRAEAARVQAEADRQRAEASLRDAEAEASRARESAAASERERAELRERLRQQLNVILETRETARGLIVNLSDVLFDTAKSTLKPGAREKLAKVSGILVTHPDLKIEIEGHTDSVGSDSYNQGLSERRAESVRAYLVSQRIAPQTITTVGFGESRPVATNDTAAGRQQNRRVELVVSGEAIGTH